MVPVSVIQNWWYWRSTRLLPRSHLATVQNWTGTKLEILTKTADSCSRIFHAYSLTYLHSVPPTRPPQYLWHTCPTWGLMTNVTPWTVLYWSSRETAEYFLPPSQDFILNFCLVQDITALIFNALMTAELNVLSAKELIPSAEPQFCGARKVRDDSLRWKDTVDKGSSSRLNKHGNEASDSINSGKFLNNYSIISFSRTVHCVVVFQNEHFPLNTFHML
jgi:hypothetical protein